MILTDMNYWSIPAGIAAHMAVGSLWYSKLLFGERWLELMGLAEEDLNPGPAMGLAVVMAGLASFVFGVVMQWVGPPDGSGVTQGVILGLVIWTGFSLHTLGTHFVFSGGTRALFWINAGNYVTSYTLMGAVMGWVQWGI